VRGPYTLTLFPGAPACCSPVPRGGRGHADCLRAARGPRQLAKAAAAVAEFKAAVARVEQACRAVAETVLLSVERKRVYGVAEFAEAQAQHRVLVSPAPRARPRREPARPLGRPVPDSAWSALCCAMLCRARMRATCAGAHAWGLAVRPVLLLTRAHAAAGAGAPGACARGHQRHACAPPHLLRHRLGRGAARVGALHGQGASPARRRRQQAAARGLACPASSAAALAARALSLDA